MMKHLIFLTVFLVTGFFAKAQDYFTDRNNSGTPVFLVRNGDTTNKQYLFSAAANISDATSLKVNFYKQNWGVPKDLGPNKLAIGAFGWGASLNAATKAGVGSILGGGNFDPAFSGGVYFAFTKFTTWTDDSGALHSKYHAWILSSNLTFATNQLYNPAADFGSQLSSKNFVGPSLALSYVFEPALNNNDLFLGGSFTYKKMSNYADLDSYTITNDSLTTGSGITRKVTKINPNGDTYAVGDYKEFSNYELRGNISFIPGALKYRVGVILYPSVDFGGPYSARVNTGVAFNYLTDKNPTLSIFSINMELDDIGNAEGSKKTFLKRAFKIGVSTSLNAITGSK
jgi:hypothetical protein